MLSASFFEANIKLKRMMNNKFKELGYDLPMKKRVLLDVLKYKAKLSDLKISEMEQVIKYLNNVDTQEEEVV